MSSLTSQVQHAKESLDSTTKQEKKIHINQKEKTLFIDNMIIYVENPKEFTKHS